MPSCSSGGKPQRRWLYFPKISEIHESRGVTQEFPQGLLVGPAQLNLQDFNAFATLIMQYIRDMSCVPEMTTLGTFTLNDIVQSRE